MQRKYHEQNQSALRLDGKMIQCTAQDFRRTMDILDVAHAVLFLASGASKWMTGPNSRLMAAWWPPERESFHARHPSLRSRLFAPGISGQCFTQVNLNRRWT